jgi:hypothetical protein
MSEPINRDQKDAYTGQQEPLSAVLFVVLPHHPLFGRRVTILSRHPSATSVRCIIEDPAVPGFRYVIPERWLAPSSPSEASPPPPTLRSITLPLSALDKMVQLILHTQPPRRASANEPASTRDDLADRDPTPSDDQNQPARPALSPRPDPARRHSS